MPADFYFVGHSLQVLGEIIIGYTAIRVHHRFWLEKKIDKKVFVEMKIEQKLGLVGILLIAGGWFLQHLQRFITPAF